MHGRLGDAVHVDQPGLIRMPGGEAGEGARGERLAAEDDRAEGEPGVGADLLFGADELSETPRGSD